MPDTTSCQSTKVITNLMNHLNYRFEFAPHELQAIKTCNEEHGFAVVKGMISPEYVEELKAEVRRVLDADGSLRPGKNLYNLNFVESAHASWKLFENEAYLRLVYHLLGTEACTIHRSAAIIRMPGDSGMAWHSDYSFFPYPPRQCNDVLNHLDESGGGWFYLTGTHPDHGGLALIPDSHIPDWAGPEGFELTENRGSFYRRGEAPHSHAGMDVPGMFAPLTDPGDMIIFAARTYHGVFPHNGAEPRLSCAVGLRSQEPALQVPWELPQSAKDFMAAVPEGMRQYVDGYVGIVPNWKP